MPKKANAKAAYSKADMRAVSDNPEWTKADFAKAKPFAEVFPELAKTIKRRGPQRAPTKEAENIRLSPVVLQHFRALGRGWQTKIDETLIQAISKKAKRRTG